ncbi:MAG: 30S ribosomal protein S6 [Syntrophaceae bacterium]|nr:30S ribosomal protein S6 [Syntrophaceae bacterium]
MRRYEAVVIVESDATDDEIKALTERYGDLIKSHDGEVIKIEDWGIKKLAYLVRKKDKGRYILFDFVSGPELVAELERQFKITENIMKYLTVKLDEDVDLEAFKAGAEKVEEAAPEEVAASEPISETSEEKVEAPEEPSQTKEEEV